MQYIKKLKLRNFKRFDILEVEFDQRIYTAIGDQGIREKLHSSLQLIRFRDGNKNRIESSGIETLLDQLSVTNYFHGEKTYFLTCPRFILTFFSMTRATLMFRENTNTDKLNAGGLYLILRTK